MIKRHTVYPKKYAHGFCFVVLCCGYTLTDFPISIRLTSLALWQSNDCPVPAKQPWWIWINTSCEFIMNDCITTTKQSTTKPCAYFLGYTVSDANPYTVQAKICHTFYSFGCNRLSLFNDWICLLLCMLILNLPCLDWENFTPLLEHFHENEPIYIYIYICIYWYPALVLL